MRKFFALIPIIALLFLYSCSEDNSDRKRFFDIYKEILILREQFPNAKMADKKIDSLLKANDLDPNKFEDKFIEYSKDPEQFSKDIDSLRVRAAKESLIKK